MTTPSVAHASRWWPALLALLALALPVRARDENLVVNGSFERDADGDGYPDGWPKQQGMSLAREGDSTWLVLDRYVGPTQKIAIDPDWWKLDVRCRMRTTGVVTGDQGWKNARLAMNFVDAKGAHVDPWPPVFNASGTTGWVDYRKEFTVPVGASALLLAPSMLGSSGKVEFDDVVITVSRLRSKMKESLPVPEGAGRPWDLTDAWRRRSKTRESICLNALWRFLPLTEEATDRVPAAGEGWGWFKVPGIWPRRASGEAQETLVSGWVEERVDFAKYDQAWYRREVAVPDSWRRRRILLDLTLVQTHARIFVDGRRAGAIWFPGGRLDLTPHLRPGTTHDLAALVTARPFEKESKVFMAPDRIIKNKASVALRGLTGDAYLVSEPAGPAITDVHVITTTRDMKIAMDTGIRDVGDGRYRLAADILEGDRVVKTLESGELAAGDIRNGRVSFSLEWREATLWDTDAPHLYHARVTLKDVAGAVVDESLPVRFGFREFRIDGRDFYLNDKRIHARALLVRSMSSPADLACIEGARRTCGRLRAYGFNFFITNNYHFKPGAVGYMDGLLDAADEEGLICAFSLPHIRDFNVDPKKPDTFAAYTALTRWLVRRMQNHPSAVLYAMSHNATGYKGDQNPLRIDGIFSPENPDFEGHFTREIREEALAAGAIANGIDPTRPVYHHQSGNLGAMHTVNIYLNWAPMQERSDWLEHWGTKGVKPLFFVEWGLPHVSSWSSYRGPRFIWRTEAFQQIWDSEYAAPYTGERAYRMTPAKVKSMAHEEDLWSRGKPFHWGWLIRHLRSQTENYYEIQAMFCRENWRAHRAWGVSSMLPWDQEGMWRRKPDATIEAIDVADRYADLKKPGIRPDRVSRGGGWLVTPDADAIEPTVLGRAFQRWNMPLCAWIGGGPKRFTEKGHNVLAGETVRKQLVILNDTRREVSCRWSWKLSPGKYRRRGRATIAPGGRELVTVEIKLSRRTQPGEYTLTARFDFGKGGTQEDSFALHVLPVPDAPVFASRIGLFDPAGKTAAVLQGLGVTCTRIDAGSDLADVDLLIVGREALGADVDGPDFTRVRDGLKVLIFEQTFETLVDRLGFRANVHGARRVFARVPGHPALAGLTDAHLRDWRGAATLVPPYLPITRVETDNPKWNWLGNRNTRVWRCSNDGCVASVFIEKPSRGNFTPLVDCEFDLQYAPLLEYVEGRGRVIFCQLDVTGRTEDDPAARRVVLNLLGYLDTAPSPSFRRVFHNGDKRSARLLEQLGITANLSGIGIIAQPLRVIAPGTIRNAIPEMARKGENILCLGLDADHLRTIFPDAPRTEMKPTVSSTIECFTCPEFAGISNAELHWKTRPRIAALADASEESSEALRVIERGKGRIVLCQAAPWMFDYEKRPYLRTTYRRNVFLVSRLLANLGAESGTPLLERLGRKTGLYDWPLPKSWKGKVDRKEVGEGRGWQQPHLDDSDWKPIEVPGAFDRQVPGLADYDGVFWYRLRFRVPENLAPEGLRLHLGGVDDESWTWLNGRFLGEVTKKTRPKDYWAFPRVYEMKPGMLRADRENVLVVRCRDTYQTGGITGTPRLVAPGPWLQSYYVQEPEAIDDPYRYYRW